MIPLKSRSGRPRTSPGLVYIKKVLHSFVSRVRAESEIEEADREEDVAYHRIGVTSGHPC